MKDGYTERHLKTLGKHRFCLGVSSKQKHRPHRTARKIKKFGGKYAQPDAG